MKCGAKCFTMPERYGNVLRCYNNTMIAKNQFLKDIWVVLLERMGFWHSLRSWQGKKLGTSIVLCSFLVRTPSASSNSRNSAQALCRFIYKHSRYCILQRLCLYIKMRVLLHSHSFLVGVTGLEPMASWPPVKRATKLRYTPIEFIKFVFLLSLFDAVTLCLGARSRISVRSCGFNTSWQVMLWDMVQFHLRSLLIANQTALYPDLSY